MSDHVTRTFDVTSWNELASEDKEGAAIARVRLTKTFHGDLDATGTAEILTVTTPAGPRRTSGSNTSRAPSAAAKAHSSSSTARAATTAGSG